MNSISMSGAGGLVTAEVVPKKETYYLVTEDSLKSIQGKNILADVSVVLASVLWGAYFSVLITTKASASLLADTRQALEIYQRVFWLAAVLISIAAVILSCVTYRAINRIKRLALGGNRLQSP